MQSHRKKSTPEVCCVNCGSNMVIELEGAGEEDDAENDICVGIPVCEALDLENISGQSSPLPNTNLR